MRNLWLHIFWIAVALDSFAKPISPQHDICHFTQLKAERTVIGALSDVSAKYDHGRSITVIHILEFETDVFPQEPVLWEVRLCGDQSNILEPSVHTNIAIVYALASTSRLTGCLGLISVDPWQDSSKWQAIHWNPNNVKRSIHLDSFIQSIINGTVAH